MKLHLGCGDVRLEGFVNIDARYGPAVDRVLNAGILQKYYPANSVDLIYASHILDQFDRWTYPEVLKRWCSVLKPGGILRLAVVDFQAVAELYLGGCQLRTLQGLLCSGQDYPGNVRHVLWDRALLTNDLILAGFGEIRSWDWRTVEHSATDDYSRAYIPHLDFEKGRLVSLNLEAVK